MRLKNLPIEVQISFKTNLEGLYVSLFGDESSTPAQPVSDMAIGDRIQIARENLDMSKEDLAEKLDIHPGDVFTWEEGNDQPLAGVIIPLANALKCDPMWLLTGQSSNANQVTPAPVNVMMGVDMANIGVRIESRRNEMGISPLKLAEKIDTSRAMILEWETGKAIPHSGYYDRLAKALNTSVTWLMTGKDINADSNKFQ